MKRLLVILTMAGLVLAACAGPTGTIGGGSFDDPSTPLGAGTTPVAVVPTDAPSPTDTPLISTCPPETLNLGDPALWVEGSTVVIAIGITEPGLLPARLTSDNGLDTELRTLDEFALGVSYGPLDPVPSPARTLILTLANGAVCTATATILSATPTPVATSTPLPTATPTPLPTLTPTPTPTLAPVVAVTPTRMVTSTPGMAPVTGGGEDQQMPPESPLDQLWKLIQIFFGGG